MLKRTLKSNYLLQRFVVIAVKRYFSEDLRHQVAQTNFIL